MRKAYKVSIIVGVLIGLVGLSFFLIGWREPHWALSLRDPEVEDVLNYILHSHEQSYDLSKDG